MRARDGVDDTVEGVRRGLAGGAKFKAMQLRGRHRPDGRTDAFCKEVTTARRIEGLDDRACGTGRGERDGDSRVAERGFNEGREARRIERAPRRVGGRHDDLMAGCAQEFGQHIAGFRGTNNGHALAPGESFVERACERLSNVFFGHEVGAQAFSREGAGGSRSNRRDDASCKMPRVEAQRAHAFEGAHDAVFARKDDRVEGVHGAQGLVEAGRVRGRNNGDGRKRHNPCSARFELVGKRANLMSRARHHHDESAKLIAAKLNAWSVGGTMLFACVEKLTSLVGQHGHVLNGLGGMPVHEACCGGHAREFNHVEDTCGRGARRGFAQRTHESTRQVIDAPGGHGNEAGRGVRGHLPHGAGVFGEVVR